MHRSLAAVYIQIEFVEFLEMAINQSKKPKDALLEIKF